MEYFASLTAYGRLHDFSSFFLWKQVGNHRSFPNSIDDMHSGFEPY